MKKILVISSYPAPYRVGVFQELDTFYQLDVFFEFIEDQSRSPEWFVRNGNFHVLNTPDAKEAFAWSLHLSLKAGMAAAGTGHYVLCFYRWLCASGYRP